MNVKSREKSSKYKTYTLVSEYSSTKIFSAANQWIEDLPPTVTSRLNFMNEYDVIILQHSLSSILSYLSKEKKLPQNIIENAKNILEDQCYFDIPAIEQIFSKMKELEKKYCMDVRIAIELKEKRKIIFNHNGVIYVNKERYYIFSYNVVHHNTQQMSLSDYIIVESLHYDDFLNVLQRIEEEIQFMFKKKIKLIDIESYDLYFHPYATGIFFHEFIGHLLEADHFFTSPLVYQQGFKFKENINIIENYGLYQRYDDLGNIIYPNIELVKKGKLKNLLNSEITKYIYRQQSSGNAIQGNNTADIYPRMQHMYICPGAKPIEDSLTQTMKGVYVKKLNMGEVNTYTGDFTVEVEMSYLIENGKCTSEVEPFMMTFNIFELANRELLLGNEVKTFYNLCGKRGSIVKVAYTVPALGIKASTKE